ncbi:MAG: hypothetical protein PHE09_01325 [Oscillospiraceae bacterium]|nr:hypothetical protein [Oscillospiraceae bacterium]
MENKGYKQLNIDTEFKTLIRPLSRGEHSQLEANLVNDGCRDPIITWNGTIVDGHNRYEICNRLHIPYAVQELWFASREEAIVWICNNQLGRRNITEETRKYLIGRQYEAEKVIGFHRNRNGHNQWSASSEAETEEESVELERRESGRRTANRLGKKYHISSGAVQKYAKYSAALDAVGDKAPELVPQILSGNYKISHDNLVTLSMMDAEEVKHLSQKIGRGSSSFVRYSESRKDFTDEPAGKPGPKPAELPAIKTMPAFDPDAEVAGLTLTIPSWTSSIERTKNAADLNSVSPLAKGQLEKALELLESKVQEMLQAIKEDS